MLTLFCSSLALPLRAEPGCSAASGERRVALLELYTSEGCDSCPPVDRWVSGLPGRGYGGDRLAVLAFHVDYWDYLGWKDPFAQRRYSERQRQIAARSGSRVVYTPQLLLNGADYRRSYFGDDFSERMASLQRAAPMAGIRLNLAVEAETLRVRVDSRVTEVSRRDHAQTWLALSEMRLSNDIRAGENRGKRLHHDFVVHDMTGPLQTGGDQLNSSDHRFRLQPAWKRNDLVVTAFVQDARRGEVMQAVTVPLSDCAGNARAQLTDRDPSGTFPPSPVSTGARR